MRTVVAMIKEGFVFRTVVESKRRESGTEAANRDADHVSLPEILLSLENQEYQDRG